MDVFSGPSSHHHSGGGTGNPSLLSSTSQPPPPLSSSLAALAAAGAVGVGGPGGLPGIHDRQRALNNERRRHARTTVLKRALELEKNAYESYNDHLRDEKLDPFQISPTLSLFSSTASHHVPPPPSHSQSQRAGRRLTASANDGLSTKRSSSGAHFRMGNRNGDSDDGDEDSDRDPSAIHHRFSRSQSSLATTSTKVRPRAGVRPVTVLERGRFSSGAESPSPTHNRYGSPGQTASTIHPSDMTRSPSSSPPKSRPEIRGLRNGSHLRRGGSGGGGNRRKGAAGSAHETSSGTLDSPGAIFLTQLQVFSGSSANLPVPVPGPAALRPAGTGSTAALSSSSPPSLAAGKTGSGILHGLSESDSGPLSMSQLHDGNHYQDSSGGSPVRSTSTSGNAGDERALLQAARAAYRRTVLRRLKHVERSSRETLRQRQRELDAVIENRVSRVAEGREERQLALQREHLKKTRRRAEYAEQLRLEQESRLSGYMERDRMVEGREEICRQRLAERSDALRQRSGERMFMAQQQREDLDRSRRDTLLQAIQREEERERTALAERWLQLEIAAEERERRQAEVRRRIGEIQEHDQERLIRIVNKLESKLGRIEQLRANMEMEKRQVQRQRKQDYIYDHLVREMMEDIQHHKKFDKLKEFDIQHLNKRLESFGINKNEDSVHLPTAEYGVEERRRACSLCQYVFKEKCLTSSVTWKKIRELVDSWGVADRLNVTRGRCTSTMYDLVPICAFCSQFFESSDDADPASAPSTNVSPSSSRAASRGASRQGSSPPPSSYKLQSPIRSMSTSIVEGGGRLQSSGTPGARPSTMSSSISSSTAGISRSDTWSRLVARHTYINDASESDDSYGDLQA